VFNEVRKQYFFNIETDDKELSKSVHVHLEPFNLRVKQYMKKRGEREVEILRVYDKQFCSLLKATSTSWNNYVNEREFREGFLRGVFDTAYLRIDLDVIAPNKKRWNVRITDNDPEFLLDVKKLLKDMGIGCNVYKMNVVFCLDIAGKFNLKQFRNKIGFSLERKQAALEKSLL
jgi:hypothetical protein